MRIIDGSRAGRHTGLPPGGINDTDFFLTFELIGKYKNTYGLRAGEIQPELSKIHASGTERCPGDGRSASFTYPFIGSNRLVPMGRARPGASGLTGSASAGDDSLQWRLTRG